jgi:hypothetical protein
MNRVHPDYVVTWWSDGTVTVQQFVPVATLYKGEWCTMVNPHGAPVQVDPALYVWNIEQYYQHTAHENAPIDWEAHESGEH